MTATKSSVSVQPLLSEDPPRIGSFWLRGRVLVNSAGLVYAGWHDDGGSAAVTMMAEGAAADAAARERFGCAVDLLPAGVVLARSDADDDVAHWVAVADPDQQPVPRELNGQPPEVSPVAQRHAAEVLSAVLMDRVPQLGRMRGPDFLHHWHGRHRPGLFRLWPLPWPAMLRAASRMALWLSMLAMLALMALAVLIAWLLFRNQPEVDPGPLIPGPTGSSATVTPSTPSTSISGTAPTSRGTSQTPGRPSTGRLPTVSPSGGSANPEDRF